MEAAILFTTGGCWEEALLSAHVRERGDTRGKRGGMEIDPSTSEAGLPERKKEGGRRTPMCYANQWGRREKGERRTGPPSTEKRPSPQALA